MDAKLFSLRSPGGAISNLYAVELARQRALPECKQRGMTAAPRLVMFTSEQVRQRTMQCSFIHAYVMGVASVRNTKL